MIAGLTRKHANASLQIHLISTVEAQLVTSRVSSNQKEYVLSGYISDWFTDTVAMIEYVYPRVKEAYPYINTPSKFFHFIENHPRLAARAKSILRMTNNNPGARVPCELRIPLGFVVDFNLVTKQEDPIFHGSAVIKNKKGELHMFYELKEQRKESIQSAAVNHTFSSASPFQRAASSFASIPEEVSIASSGRRRSGGASRAGGTRASAMSISSGSDNDEWYNELGAVETQMNRDMAAASVAANAFEVTTVYTQETESSRKPSPTKKQKKAPAGSVSSVVSARTSKSSKSVKSSVTTRSTSKQPAASAVSPSASTRSKRRAEREEEEDEWEPECPGAPESEDDGEDSL